MEYTETKKCGKCGKAKPFSAFYYRLSTNGHKGYYSPCKVCKEKARKQYRKNNPHILKNEKLKKSFGISLDEYKAKLLQQRGVCAICGQPETALSRSGKIKMLSVDHCHKTNQIRGLLCDTCNHLIGNANDDMSVLDSAIRYLTFWRNI